MKKAHLKKLSDCNTDLKVQSELKHGNFKFIFSAGMYELYRDALRDHYACLNDDQGQVWK